MSRVRVLSVSHVHPAQTTDPSALPRAADYKLSFLDVVHVPKVPIQRLFFFDGPDLPPFPSVVGALRSSSLAATLAVFFPLAGELAFRASTGDVVIDCSTPAVSSGVRFVEAEYSGGADDMRRMASDDRHDTEAFLQLVPEMDVRQLPAPILAVQVTRPAPAPAAGKGSGVGAVAVGVSILHAVADGQAMWQFMRAWSTASREGSGSLAAAGLPPPTFDRAAIRHPKTDELCRMCLDMFAPALPLLRPPSSSSPTPDVTQQSRRTFVLSTDRIQSLKQHISRSGLIAAGVGGGQPPSSPPSTYVAVSSLVWVSMVRAKSMNHAEDAHFSVAADCRRRLRPPVSEGYFGNCVRACFARVNAGDLRGGGGVARAAAAIQGCIREQLEAPDDPLPMPSFVSLLEVFRGIPMERLTSVGSSHRFMAYETDFGWGAPLRVELVSMFRRELVTLLGAREGGGAVQVSVALDDGALMDAFAANFLAGQGAEAEW